MRRKAHYVLSTHWDREWYQPFQDYRYRLVQLLDRVLDGWQREDLCGSFQTDGQAIVLEDYLEIRPEREAQIEQLVRDGRFVVGPWYVLPDEFLVSGESILRNIELGRKIARRFGGTPSDAGFMCDMFGHNSQIPQIFAGFGIRAGFLWRGTNLVDERLFRWRGADGTELPCYRFGKIGYCSYAIQVRVADSSKARPTPTDIENRLLAFLEEENEKTRVGPLLLFDGCDHMEWDPGAYQVLKGHMNGANERYDIVHSSLDVYLDEMVKEAGKIGPALEGELREPGLYTGEIDAQWLIPGVTSSRVKIKQANALCQDLLCQWAEPISVFANVVIDMAYPQGFLDVAWRWLLMNHPHDSICGCSIDSVHEDMFYRFHQAEQIASRLRTEAARRIAASVTGKINSNELRVVIFNPLPRPFDGVADLNLEIPETWPKAHETMGYFEGEPSFHIYAVDGSELAYQRTGQALERNRLRTMDWATPDGYRVNVVSASLPLQIPALGYTTLILRPGSSDIQVRFPITAGLATSERSMANENLTVQFEPDGTLTLTDRRNMQVYHRLLTFEDRADIGDGWNFGPAANDQTFFSTGSRYSLSLVTNGPNRATFRLRTVMDVPQDFRFDNMIRSNDFRALVIDNLVTLRAGADWIEVETTVHNDICDHRMRVIFPSGAATDTCLMDTPFDVVERPIALRSDNFLYRELEVETRPQQSFTAVSDQHRGLAVISDGLLECAVQDLPERPIALTLFRATQKTVMTNGEPGGQMQGDLHFRYWLTPLSGQPDRARLFDLGQALSGGLYAVFLNDYDVKRFHQNRELPPSGGFLEVRGQAIVTSLRGEKGGEVRLFNPNTHPVKVELDFSDRPNGSDLPVIAQPVNFEGQPAGTPFSVKNGKAVIPLGPKQIRTIRL